MKLLNFKKYKFSDKTQTLGGILSLLFAAGAIFSFGYGVYISFLSKGHGGLMVGSLGLLSLMLAIMGTIIGLLSFKESDKFYTLSKVGSLICGIFSVFMIAVLLMGIV